MILKYCFYSFRYVLRYLLAIHSFGGCDTTATTFDKGKKFISKLVEKSSVARAQCDVFLTPNATDEEIGTAGIRLFVLLYGGKENDTLANLRHGNYMKMASQSTAIKSIKASTNREGSMVSQFTELITRLSMETIVRM